MFIDTHAHLNVDPFYKDVTPYIEKALEAGVERIVVPGIDIETSERAIELADRYNGVYAAVGVHPHDSVEAPVDYLRLIEDMLKHPKVCAVGEVGLDYFRDYAPAAVQKKVFYDQVALAKSYGYPLIVHNRSADADTFNILHALNYFNVQFHCYGSDEKFAKVILKKGVMISFTGVVTFSDHAREIIATIPLDKLMIETDSPWMAPVPHRGKLNQPAYVVEIAKTYGHVFGKSLEEIEKITTNNARMFF